MAVQPDGLRESKYVLSSTDGKDPPRYATNPNGVPNSQLAVQVNAKGHPAGLPSCQYDCMCNAEASEGRVAESSQCENAGGCPVERTDCGWGS